jgi:proteasome lid subunit RPN8/RPN11
VTSKIPIVRLPITIREAMVERARVEAPIEACGVFLMLESTVELFYPMENVAANPEQGFEFAPGALLHVLQDALADAGAWPPPPSLLFGIFHSHPRGPAEPSPRDCATARLLSSAATLGWPWPWLIVGRDAEIRAWWFSADGSQVEMPLAVVHTVTGMQAELN